MKEDKYDKAKRLFKNNNVTVIEANFGIIRATVGGDTDTYQCHFFKDGRFGCSCKCYIQTGGKKICSHLLALTLHPVYKNWYPLRLKNNKPLVEEEVKKYMLDFSLPPHKSHMER